MSNVSQTATLLSNVSQLATFRFNIIQSAEHSHFFSLPLFSQIFTRLCFEVIKDDLGGGTFASLSSSTSLYMDIPADIISTYLFPETKSKGLGLR